MRFGLRTILVACPFILNSLYAEEDGHPYYLEDEIADEEDSYEDALSMNEEDQSSMQKPRDGCHSPFHKMHVGLRHTEARGVGYRSGYSTLEGFGIYDRNNYFMPFLDLRGHVFDDGKFAGNVGIGERTALFSISHFLGIYCYYDVRQDRHGLTVNQISPGIEVVGSRMEYRLNGYFPVGDAKSHKYNNSFDKFHGHHIIMKRKQRKALTGGDAEIGVHMTQSTKYDLYGAGGTYYFSASDISSWGGKARLMGRYKEYITLEASYSYDRLFHSIVQGTVAFNLPFGGKLKRRDKNCEDKNSLWFSRAAFAPQRFEIPVVKKITHKSKAINPATGKPWQVWFVNNTSHSNGTYKSPFSMLADAQNASSKNDMIYVFPGDGTTTGMDVGITLKDGQSLFGSGISHTIATTKGHLKIPRFSKTAPLITNKGSGDVVDLGNGNTVSGMNILVGSTGGTSGISTLASNIVGATIQNNIISATSAATSGIILFASGTVNVSNNFITSPNTSTVNAIGISQQGVLQLNIDHNAMIGYNSPIVIAGLITPTTASVSIQDNAVAGFGARGISVSTIEAGQISIRQNAIIGLAATTSGISIAGSTYVNLTSNQVAVGSGVTSGISVDSTALSSGATCRAILSANNVAVASGGTNGILLNTSAGNTICSSMAGNLVAPGPTNGFNLNGAGRINIDAFDDNVGSSVSITGNVSFVTPDTCGP